MVYKLVLENLKHRPVRTLLSVLAIGLGVTMILTLVGVGEGMMADQRKRQKAVGADIIVRAPGTSALTAGSMSMNAKLVDYVAKQPHVAVATGTGIVPVSQFVSLTGINYEEFEKMSGGVQFLAGRRYQQPNEIIVDEVYAREKNLSPGSSVKLANLDWVVSGVFRSGMMTRIMLPLGVLQDKTSNPDKISMIYVKLDDAKNTKLVIDALKQELPDYPIYSIEELMSLYSVDNIPELRAFIRVVVSLAVVFGFLVVFLTMYTAILERTREIGILKSLGAGPGYILGIMLRETVLLGLSGCVAGILLSYGTRWLIGRLIPTFGQAIVYSWWPIASGITLAGAILGVLYPAMKAARQDTLASLNYD